MSFGFRERVNRDKPRLSDRLRGKSGEEIVEELRKDFAKRKQMFFDTAPRTPEFMKPGFPFDDTTRWRNRGDSDLKHRLDEIAQRYPQFADQLRDWTSDEESPSGMGWGNKQTQSQPSTPQQATGQAAQTEAATTTQQPAAPTQQTGPEGDARTQRAMSAPPDNRAKEQPQRFVSRLEINPNTTSGETTQTTEQPQPQPSQPVNQQQQQPQPSQQQSAQPEPKKKASNVRHIPIFVEDRNETVMPRADVDSSTADFGKSFGSPPRERDSRDREDGFHGPAYAKYAPPAFGYMNKPKWRSSPFMPWDPMASPPSSQEHFPQRQQHAHSQHHQPQQQTPHPHQHHPQQHHPQQHHPQQHHPQQHHPQQQHPQQHPPQQQKPHPEQPHPEPPRQQTPPRQPPPKPKDPLEVVAAVQKDVDELMKQVEAFTGARQDKQYIYLDEMLTRNLLKLDLVETEGKENVRAARKETIRCIQKAISILESKVMTPEEIAARDKAMEVDPEPAEEVQSMEVSSGGEGDKVATQTPGPADSSEPSPAPVPSATPAPEVPSEQSTDPAPVPVQAAEPEAMDTSKTPAEEPKSMEAGDSNSSATANPETSAQPTSATETMATATPENNPPAEVAAPAAAS